MSVQNIIDLTKLLDGAVDPDIDWYRAYFTRLTSTGILLKYQVGYNEPTVEADGQVRVGLQTFANLRQLLDHNLGSFNAHVDAFRKKEKRISLLQEETVTYDILVKDSFQEKSFRNIPLAQLTTEPLTHWMAGLANQTFSIHITLNQDMEAIESKITQFFPDPEVELRRMQKSLDAVVAGKLFIEEGSEFVNIAREVRQNIRNVKQVRVLLDTLSYSSFRPASKNKRILEQYQLNVERCRQELAKMEREIKFFQNPNSYFNCAYLNHVGPESKFYLLYPKL